MRIKLNQAVLLIIESLSDILLCWWVNVGDCVGG